VSLVDFYLQAVGTSATVNTTLLHHSTGNSTIDSTELGAALDQVGKDEFVIMAVQPLQAYDIWTAALALVWSGSSIQQNQD
jgi:hypothetical protein